MRQFLSLYWKRIVLMLLLSFALYTRFYNLDWGSPFYFHPDERNIASSVTQLQFPTQMNPHFFAYGSLPIYAYYFTGVAQNILTHTTPVTTVSFSQAIIISRLYSAIFSVLLVVLMYLIGIRLKNETLGISLAFLSTMSVGFIQFAHFGTFEMWITVFSVLLFFVLLQKPHSARKNILSAIFFGILLSVKVSNIVLLPLPLFSFFLEKKPSKRKFLFFFLRNILLFIYISALVYISTNPFVFLDYQSFRASMQYESAVALGTLPVFYTQTFIDTIPVAYQFIKVYPFLLNPVVTILFIPALILFLRKIWQKRHYSDILILLFFFSLFFSQAFFHVKWTRYMVPTLPFIYIILSSITSQFHDTYTKFLKLAVFLIASVFAISYFITAFIRPDTRVSASLFAEKAVPHESTILSEVYDLGIVPFNTSFPSITLFNFYDLDVHSTDYTNTSLAESVATSRYIVLPSQRVIESRIHNPSRFPLSHRFYKDLISNNSEFEKAYETPCDIFCTITYIGSPLFSYEQTASVFDRPTVMIFKKK